MPVRVVYLCCIGCNISLSRVCTLVQSDTLERYKHKIDDNDNHNINTSYRHTI